MSEPQTSEQRGWWSRLWQRLTCRHNWDPVYHSYHCDKCGACSYD